MSSWRPPKAEPVYFRAEKVAAVVMVESEITRRQAEDVLAEEITHYGAKGVPMYTLLAEAPAGNEEAARKALTAAGVKGVVVMRPQGKRTKTETHEYTYSQPYYGGYWGGYYGYGWGAAWSPHSGLPPTQPLPTYGYATTGPETTTTTTTTEVVVVEVLVYSLAQNTLCWAGESESTPPEKVDEFVVQLAAATAKELAPKGLIASR